MPKWVNGGVFLMWRVGIIVHREDWRTIGDGFERVSRVPGSDPSVFAVELETFAMRAFGNLSPLTRLQLVRDQFIAGQVGCTLRRHLDSVEPETPIQDIVDRCRMWESHVEFVGHAGTGNGQTGATADITPEDQELLGSLMRHLLPPIPFGA